MLRSFLFAVILLIVSQASQFSFAQRILTTPDFTAFKVRDGKGEPYFSSILQVPDGGLILAGRFEVWYEGTRFRDLMRLRPTGEPDTSWRVDISYREPFSGVYGAVLTPTGVFIRGYYATKVNGVATGPWPYISLADGRLINPPAPSAASYSIAYDNGDGSTSLSLTEVSTYDSATGHVYVALNPDRWVIRRISAVTGELDPVWGYRVSTGYWIGVADSLGGLWNGSCESSFMITTCGLGRIPLGRSTSTLERPDFVRPQLSFAMPRPGRPADGKVLTNGRHAYALQRRFGADGIADPIWVTANQPWYIGPKYAYFPTTPRTTFESTPVPATLKRALLSGTGEPEAWTFTLPLEFSVSFDYYGSGSGIVSWPTPGDSDNVAVFAGTAFVVKDDLTPEEPLNVVEYYVPALKHYFMTGRKNEQATLDALPASFTRTGMSFAAKSSRYRDIAEQPVCRLYAAPEKGGSNSHFYGIGDDCPTLNKLTGLKYEGFDFSVLKPATSGCPATAPNAVTRLFNNKAAANDGNHRYVVSAATKARMIAQGWIDEGAVFCSSSVTDAVLN